MPLHNSLFTLLLSSSWGDQFDQFCFPMRGSLSRSAETSSAMSESCVDVWEGWHTFTPLHERDAVTILLTLLTHWLPSSALKIACQPFRAQLIKVWLCLLRVACRVWEGHWDLRVFRCVKYPALKAESAAIYSLNALWRLRLLTFSAETYICFLLLPASRLSLRSMFTINDKARQQHPSCIQS